MPTPRKREKRSDHINVMGFIQERQWAILPGHLLAMIDIVQGGGNISAALEAAKQNEDLSSSVKRYFAGKQDFNPSNGEGTELPGQNYLKQKATAVIDVIGPIFPRADMFQQISGATSIESLKSQFNEAMSDDSVGDIVFHFDSPGGDVAGVNDFSQLIYDSRGKGKKITAYCSGLMASAAYWIGSACDEIVLSPTSMVGSIGVIVAVPDDRKAREKAGVHKHEIVSSISPNKNPDVATSEGRAQVQATIDDVADVFASTVARNRGVTKNKVLQKFGGGDIIVGSKAVDRGMADSLGTYQQIVEGIPQKTGPLYQPETTTKERAMAKENEKEKEKSQAKGEMDEETPGKPATKAEDGDGDEEDDEDGDNENSEEDGDAEESESKKKKSKAKAEEPKNTRDGKDGEKDAKDRKENYKEAKANATSETIARLKAIDDMKVPMGMERFVSKHKYDVGMTSDKMAALVLQRQEAIREGRMSDWEDDAKALGTKAAKAGNVAPEAGDPSDFIVAHAVAAADQMRGNRIKSKTK